MFDFVPPQGWRAESKVADAFEARGAHGFVIDDYARLIPSANISWREVVLVRSASRFLRQTGLSMSDSYLIETLCQHADFVAAQVDLFVSRFDPQLYDRESRVANAQCREQGFIEATTSVDEDRILRAFASFVSAMSRTNWFQCGRDG